MTRPSLHYRLRRGEGLLISFFAFVIWPLTGHSLGDEAPFPFLVHGHISNVWALLTLLSFYYYMYVFLLRASFNN